MNKKFCKSLLSAVLALMMILTVCAVPSFAKKIALDRSSVSIVKGYSVTLGMVGTTKKPVWTSDDDTIATVSKKGVVTGKKVGSTVIRATLGKSVYECKVTVKAGKIATDHNKVLVDKGKSVPVSVKVVGTHDLAVSSLDKSIATAALSKDGFKGDITTVNIKGISDGTTKIKIYAKGYEKSVYKYVEVRVGTGKTVNELSKSGLIVSADEIVVNENLTAEFTVSSSSVNLQDIMILSSDKHSFDVEYSVNSAKKVINVKVNGFCEGKGNIKIYSAKNKELMVLVPVTVTNNTYDVVVWNREPKKRIKTDVIYKTENEKQDIFYILEPKDCDIAHVATLLAEASGVYEYYTVYEEFPSVKKVGDTILKKKVNYGGKKVTRYVLVPDDYDEAYSNSAFAMYSGEYELYKVYANKPVAPIGCKTYEFDYGSEKRYILYEGDDYIHIAIESYNDYIK